MAKTKKEEVIEEPLAKETATVEAPKPKPSKCQRMWATTPEYMVNPYFTTNERIIVME